MPHKEVIEDICTDCPKGDSYCTLREMVLHSGISDRTLEQLKLVERLKWELSKGVSRDVGWQYAWTIFIERGYADRFDKVYQEGMKHGQLYPLVVEEKA